MREIEFRGKRLSDREWIYGYYVSHDAGETGRKHEIIFTTGNWDYVNPETVGQYTDLKDKNSKKIYEEDIVHWHHPDLGWMSLVPVMWEDYVGRYILWTAVPRRRV